MFIFSARVARILHYVCNFKFAHKIYNYHYKAIHLYTVASIITGNKMKLFSRDGKGELLYLYSLSILIMLK